MSPSNLKFKFYMMLFSNHISLLRIIVSRPYLRNSFPFLESILRRSKKLEFIKFSLRSDGRNHGLVIVMTRSWSSVIDVFPFAVTVVSQTNARICICDSRSSFLGLDISLFRIFIGYHSFSSFRCS